MILRGKRGASHGCTRTKYVRQRRTENFEGEQGRWFKDSLVFRHFAFEWEHVKGEERALQ